MCHMMADSDGELHNMATAIGLLREWFQGDHYDVSKGKRLIAIGMGAKEVDSRFLVELRRKRRAS